MIQFQTNNEWDVPVLRTDMQARAVIGPVLSWGSVSRSTIAPAWHFYVDDSRFSSVLARPEELLPTCCVHAVEPNITRHDHAPRALVLEATFRKRFAARTWQEAGVHVFVDLNIPPRHRDVCMLGVPNGWRAFATRGYSARLDDLRDEYAFAASWYGGEPLMMVVGGGKSVEAVCRELPGAVYVHDYRAQRRSVAERAGGAAPGLQAAGNS